jgi:hypothetical protein
MKKFHLFAVLTIIGAAVFTPQSSEAFFTTDQQAIRLNEQQILFTINFRFGFINHGFSLPILAERVGYSAISDERLQYALEADGVAVDYGDVTAIVLTDDEDAVVADSRYNFVPRRGADFTLMAIVTLPEVAPTTKNLSLHVTHLPFTMTDLENVTESVQLSEAELNTYRTPAVLLGAGK